MKTGAATPVDRLFCVGAVISSGPKKATPIGGIRRRGCRSAFTPVWSLRLEGVAEDDAFTARVGAANQHLGVVAAEFAYDRTQTARLRGNVDGVAKVTQTLDQGVVIAGKPAC